MAYIYTRRCGDIFCGRHCSRELQLDLNAEPCVEGGTFCKVCDPCHAVGYSEVSSFAQRDIPVAHPAAVAPPAFDAYGGGESQGWGEGEVPHFGLALPGADMPHVLLLENGSRIEIEAMIVQVRSAFEVLNLVAELVYQLPGMEAKFEVVSENRSAMDEMIPVLLDAQATFATILGGSELRSTPSAYNYLVLASKDVDQALHYIEHLDEYVMASSSPSSSSHVGAESGQGEGDSDDSASDGGGSLAVPSVGHPVAPPVAAALPVAQAVAFQGTSTDEVRGIVVGHEERVEDVVTRVLGGEGASEGAGGERDVGALEQELRVLKKKVKADMRRIGNMDETQLEGGAQARYVQRLEAVVEYIDSYANSVLAGGGIEDVASRVASLEERFFEVFARLDGVDGSDGSAVSEYEKALKTLAKDLTDARNAFAQVGDSEAQRGIDRVEDLMENVSDLTFSAEKQFGDAWGSGSSSQRSKVVVRAQASHRRAQDEMFGL